MVISHGEHQRLCLIEDANSNSIFEDSRFHPGDGLECRPPIEIVLVKVYYPQRFGAYTIEKKEISKRVKGLGCNKIYTGIKVSEKFERVLPKIF